MKNIILLFLFIILGFGSAPADAQTRNKHLTRKTKQDSFPVNETWLSQAKSGKKQRRSVTAKTPGRPVVEIVQIADAPPDQSPTVTTTVAVLPTPLPMASDGLPIKMVQPEKLFDVTLGSRMEVAVSANANTVIKIGLAERAVSVIDFPANDPVYKIHPGNENFVTVGCFGREQNGKCLNSPTDAIVLRPGKDFHALGSEESAATVITIQRVSGIVVTLLVQPVKTIAENTNYVAVAYNLEEVRAARRSAGLAVNLLPVGLKVSDSPNQDVVGAAEGNSVVQNIALVKGADVPAETSSDSPGSLEKALVEEIKRAADNESALKFLKPVYGLSLARASNYASRVNDITVEVVAVRNTLPSAVRLVPDQPTLAVENKDKQKVSINVEVINLLHTATTVEDSEVLEPGRVYYFAFAYRSPILGVKQSLRVNFAQREAADAPASLELSGGNR